MMNIITLIFCIGYLVLAVFMIIRYFQMARNVRKLKDWSENTGHYSDFHDVLLGDEATLKKQLIIDLTKQVGASLNQKEVLTSAEFQSMTKRFVTRAEKLGIEFGEEELSKITDFTRFKNLYKVCVPVK